MASTVTKIVTTTVSATTTPSSTVRAAPQGGILEGANPSKYDPKNPINLFIIQAGIIIIFCRLLHLPLSKLRQPRVIAEVIGGILLGPSVMGRIPGFTDAIFPAASMATLNTAANIGLILFLFLVGLEVDLRLFLNNWRVALTVSAAGMVLPFGLGCAIAYGLYHEFRTDANIVPISFGTYMLFIGVAMAITAFPVLCRILTELKLLGTDVGVTVLAAGVGNDVVGWILLALCVALVNAGTGLTALWVLLTAVAFILFLVFAVRPAFMILLRRTGSIQNGPTQTVVALTVLLVLTSAFFTAIIGIHPIFGAFIVGLICPHDGGFSIKLTEKIEDLVSVLFLPLYFALSGLSTNLGLLNSGITWAYVIGVIAIAFIAKITGGTLAARFNKLVWRESFTIGVLMSCKGLVELIVLNIGLQAKILSQRTFTIFVVMALVTTFATTPLTSLLYPPWYQRKLGAWKRGEIDWDGVRLNPSDQNGTEDSSVEKLDQAGIRRLLIYLRLDSMPGLLALMALFSGDPDTTPEAKVHHLKQGQGESTNDNDKLLTRRRNLQIHGMRLVELTERTSSVMQVSEIEDYDSRDPVVNLFRTFGKLNNVAVSGGVSVVPEGQFADALQSKALDTQSDMVFIPWSETGSMSEGSDSFFVKNSTDRFTSGPHNAFIGNALANASCNTAIFINKGFGGPSFDTDEALARTRSHLSIRSFRREAALSSPLVDRSHHIFFPYFGGADDHVALRFVLQLARNPNVTATIIHVKHNGSDAVVSTEIQHAKADVPAPTSTTDDHDQALFATYRDSLPSALEPRVLFDTITSSNPIDDTISRAKAEVGLASKNAGDLIIVGRRQTQQFASIAASLPSSPTVASSVGMAVGTEARRRNLGVLGEAIVLQDLRASVLVVQSRSRAGAA
ncbi:MAG: Serum paraoxonase/arylesterase 2 [Chaenotheca gracillima]|nr:MAG: Serum paraoxonase/arylesterase 2 [Chaenotheca gracillima]